MSRLDPSTRCSDIKEHLASLNIEVTEIEDLETKYTNYASFMINMPASKLKQIKMARVWAEGVYVIKYYPPRN